MAKLAILGHETRGGEVIEILEMLGGNNFYKESGERHYEVYFISNINNICSDNPRALNGIIYFTIEEFLEKFPYKVGDKVYYDNKVCNVVEMLWNSNLNTISYGIHNGKIKNLAIVEELQPYKEETMEKQIPPYMDYDVSTLEGWKQFVTEVVTKTQLKYFDRPKKGYKFAGVDNNNQQVMFEKISYHYPKTYEECCNVLKLGGK